MGLLLHLCIGITSYFREIGGKPTLVDNRALGHSCYRINKFITSSLYVNVLYIILKTISDYFRDHFAFKMDIFSLR
jgi:hypothetical protein